MGIITVVNNLVDGIFAFVGAVQPHRLGAGTYIAYLVGVPVTREMAPITAAIVLTGHTGGAYATQISTMQDSKEIGVLHVLGKQDRGWRGLRR